MTSLLMSYRDGTPDSHVLASEAITPANGSMPLMAEKSGPLRDLHGTAKYRHEMVAVVLRVDPVDGLCVLLTRRHREPFTGRWALPSGALEPDEHLSDCVLRHLTHHTGLPALSHLEQLETHGSPHRDPADRTVATAYLGLVGPRSGRVDESAVWLPVTMAGADSMAFDHPLFVSAAVDRLRAKLSYTNIGFALAGDEFTMSELRDIYIAVLGHQVSSTNLRRVLSRRGQLEATGTAAPPRSGGGRPAAQFRFTTHTLQVTDPFAVLRP